MLELVLSNGSWYVEIASPYSDVESPTDKKVSDVPLTVRKRYVNKGAVESLALPFAAEDGGLAIP